MTVLSSNLPALLQQVRACTACAAHLPAGPRPVLQAAEGARILIAGQAPGRRVHASGVPFDDPSGERLRQWLGIDRAVFYDASRIAILPMGFCYPGTGTSGDLPPRPECAPLWREALLAALPAIQLTLLIGQYAQAWRLPQSSPVSAPEPAETPGEPLCKPLKPSAVPCTTAIADNPRHSGFDQVWSAKNLKAHAQATPPRRMAQSLTETVRLWREFGPEVMPLPHPSPRNNLWLKANPWFAVDVLPELQRRMREILLMP